MVLHGPGNFEDNQFVNILMATVEDEMKFIWYDHKRIESNIWCRLPPQYHNFTKFNYKILNAH